MDAGTGIYGHSSPQVSLPRRAGRHSCHNLQWAISSDSSDLAATWLQVFAGLLVGAMLPYWFSAMTMKSVGKAALAMVEEVRRQFATIPGIMEGSARPDYRLCVEISTQVP